MDSYQALQRLQEGNARYVAAKLTYANETAERRQEVAQGQHPFACILGCADSRVPPEIVFDAGLGDLFVIRVAGNIVDDLGLGSIEYAVAHLHVPLVMVLGHARCGAVQAAVAALTEGTEAPGHISALVDAIRPVAKQALTQPGDQVENTVRANVARVVERLRGARPILGERVRLGQLKIVGARYDLDSGQVAVIVP